jgi:hypothetical protein
MLDLNGPWFWILYTLAGAGVAAVTEPRFVKGTSQLERDLYVAHPPLRALMMLVLWVIWPLIVAFAVVAAVSTAALWVWDSIVYGCDWIRYGVGMLIDRVRQS